jgi:putative nucleotidyltransferase with HDIG domain
VTELLSVVALTLAEAKASGGDAVRVAGHLPQETAESQSFDILQGLVFAVDTKDRYTKLHSEDVSRYATFLASRLGLDPSFVETVRTAGLLHDIGKIGIPDTILRKPGRLTADEQGIVKQHVALGDSIVRNLENTELIRAGIRHHHERWDGRGYLHALASDDIPLIARILAVADAYSAMTTSRPYRKALSVEESLIRLADAAGTQLDESLVAVFITGIEQVPDAPMPGVVKGVPLWVPRVA